MKKITQEEKNAFEAEEKALKEQIYNGKTEDEYLKWMQTLGPEEINKELKRLKEIQPKLKELAKKQGKLFQFYFQDIVSSFKVLFHFIYLYLPNFLINTFQTFLILEKLFGLHPFGHLSWQVIFLPTIIDVGFRVYDLQKKKK